MIYYRYDFRLRIDGNMKKIKICLIKIVTVIDVLLTAIFAFTAPLLLFSAWWMFRTWNNLTMDELVFHLTGPLEGTNMDMVKEYIVQCAIPALVVLIVVIIIMIVLRKNRFFYLVDGILLVGFILLSFGTWYVTASKLDLDGYLSAQSSYSEFIDDNYVNPAETPITFPEQKRNLIYIYLESMETTYADEENGGAFDENVIPELTKIAQENEDFSGKESKINGAYALQGSTWTMGAMFGHTSGLPLNISIDGNNMDTQDSFFSGAVTLGDILRDQGYSQTLLIGSDATFGGRRLYFTEHGNYDIIDHPYATQNGMLPEDYYVWWGYEDLHLFDFAKEKLQELSSQDSPFNLTMLTVDTHFEDGYVCEKCKNTYGEDQYANVMACSSKQLEEFIQWVQEQDFYENTTIVLAGDHLTMDSDFCNDVSVDYDRKTYTAYINSAVEVEMDTSRVYTTFDHFPTTLAALGAQIEGNRLGLGVNLFSSEETLSERYGIEYENKELKKRSELIDRLADIDEENPELMVREGKGPTVNIQVGEYQTDRGVLPLTVTEIENVQGKVQSVVAAVWGNDDQSDLQWIPMQSDGEGGYQLDIDMAKYGYKSGEYNIHIYFIDDSGEQYKVGEIIGVVE